jgi:hypothetical protein
MIISELSAEAAFQRHARVTLLPPRGGKVYRSDAFDRWELQFRRKAVKEQRGDQPANARVVTQGDHAAQVIRLRGWRGRLG